MSDNEWAIPLIARRAALAQEMNDLIENEHLTLDQLGKRYGMTRERARQILNKHGFSTRSRGRKVYDPLDHLDYCSWCGQEFVAAEPEWHGTRKTATGETVKQIIEKSGLIHGIMAHSRKAGHPNPTRVPKGGIEVSEGVANDYELGMRPEDIKAKWGLRHVETIYRHLERWGVEPRYERGRTRPIGKDMAKKKKIAKEYTTTYLTSGELGAKYGVSGTRISQIVRTLGVTDPRRASSWRFLSERRKRGLTDGKYRPKSGIWTGPRVSKLPRREAQVREM